MIEAQALIERLSSAGYRDWLGIPCSYLSPLFSLATESEAITWHPSARETDALAYACGLRLGGRRVVLLTQNSGFLSSLDVIASLLQPFQVPVLLIISLRGDPMGEADAEHHLLAGEITERLLEQLDIPARRLDPKLSVEENLAPLLETLEGAQQSAALLVPKGSFAPLADPLTTAQLSAAEAARPSRREVLEVIAECLGADELIVTTTGHTTRELLLLEHRAAHFPMVGSMGCVAALGAGWAATGRPVTVVDGDGSFLMGLSAAPLVARAQAPLRHLILDNGRYASTGAQETGFSELSIPALCHASGYSSVHQIDSLDALRERLRAPAQAPECIYIPISSAPSDCALPRPDEPLAEIAGRFLQEGEG